MQRYTLAEFLKGATVRPRSRANFSRDCAWFGLKPKMHNFPPFYLFWSTLSFFGGILAYFVCAKFVDRRFGCAKKINFLTLCVTAALLSMFVKKNNFRNYLNQKLKSWSKKNFLSDLVIKKIKPNGFRQTFIKNQLKLIFQKKWTLMY